MSAGRQLLSFAAAMQEATSTSTSCLLDSLATLDDHPRSLYTAGACDSSRCIRIQP